MIYKAEWRGEYQREILPRLAVAHRIFAGYAAALRNEGGFDIWTETPSDQEKLTPGKDNRSLEGWRVFHRDERATLVTWRNANGALLQAFDAQGKTALDGYLASLATIGQTLAAIAANYVVNGVMQQTRISTDDRLLLAATIEGQLQP